MPRFGRPLPRGSLQRERDDALCLGIRNLAQRTRARLVQQTGPLLAHEAIPPATHGLWRDANGRGDLTVRLARRARQDEARTLRRAPLRVGWGPMPHAPVFLRHKKLPENRVGEPPRQSPGVESLSQGSQEEVPEVRQAPAPTAVSVDTPGLHRLHIAMAMRTLAFVTRDPKGDGKGRWGGRAPSEATGLPRAASRIWQTPEFRGIPALATPCAVAASSIAT